MCIRDSIQYVETSLDNDAFAYGGTVGVTFTFDAGTVSVDAPVSAPLLPSGESDRGLGEEHSGH